MTLMIWTIKKKPTTGTSGDNEPAHLLDLIVIMLFRKLGAIQFSAL
jgi:hypothetical protein